MTSPFDLNLLVVFDTILNERSVTKAAAKLNLSQPAVSGCLARLREVFRDDLFVRTHGAMVPTPRALALGVPIRQAIARIESIREFGRPFDPATSGQFFTFSVSDYSSYLFAPLLLDEVARTAPLTTICFLDNANSPLPEALAAGDVTVGIDVLQGQPADIRHSFLLQESPFVIACAKNSALAGAGLEPGDQIPMDVFCSLPHAVRTISLLEDGLINRMLSAVSRMRHVRFVVSHFGAMGAIVQGSDMLAPVPGLLAFELARRYPVTVYRLPAELGLQPYAVKLYWHRRNDADPAHQWLRAIVTHCAQTLAASRPRYEWAQIVGDGNPRIDE